MELRWLAAVLLSATYLGLTRGADTLVPLVFSPLPLGSIKPLGWLRGEMRTMAEGLAGHEHDFYDFVRDSRWLSATGEGSDYSGLNEALPYWFNGLVPLAYSLDDDRLKGQVHSVADTVLDLQSADGWIGPEVGDDRNFWARTPFFLGLTQLADANDTWHGRVVGGLTRFMVLTNTMLKNDSLGFTRCNTNADCRWGQVRVADMILTIQWLLDHHESDIAPKNVDLLWENMRMFSEQNKYSWTDFYREDTYPKVVADPTDGNPMFPYLHGVNIGQGLKASAVIRRFTNNDSLIAASMRAVNLTFTYHGSASGTILADEIIRDLSPHTGSELCTAVETAYSLAYLFQSLGDGYYADRAELAVFNALPAMLSPDIWAHQYMDQTNQPWATKDSSGVFTTSNSGVATSYGLEPEYPCCTVNFPQGYPKFLTNSWARAATGDGLVHMLLGPSSVTTTLPKTGGRVTVTCETDYPFSATLSYTVAATAPFTLHLRIPSWSNRTVITVNSVHLTITPGSPSHTFPIALPAGKSTVTLLLSPLSPRISTRGPSSNPGSMIAIYVGPVLYALDVGQTSTSTLPHAYSDPHGAGMTHIPFPQVRDYYLSNAKPWNVAVDPGTMEYHGLDSATATLDRGVFDYQRTSTSISVKGCLVAWGTLFGGRTPADWPDGGGNGTGNGTTVVCAGGVQTFRMLPYGAAKLHMAELPVVNLSSVDEEGGALVVNAKSEGGARAMPTWAGMGTETETGAGTGTRTGTVEEEEEGEDDGGTRPTTPSEGRLAMQSVFTG